MEVNCLQNGSRFGWGKSALGEFGADQCVRGAWFAMLDEAVIISHYVDDPTDYGVGMLPSCCYLVESFDL